MKPAKTGKKQVKRHWLSKADEPATSLEAAAFIVSATMCSLLCLALLAYFLKAYINA